MPFEYLERIADTELAEKLARSGAVVIRGAKWCGKTETAKQQAASVLYMHDPDEYAHNTMLAETKPSLLLQGEQPRLIDEWQDAPQLWDAVRFAVDRQHGPGHFILTGSATPGETPKHSGVGRFSFITMRPMSLLESRDSTGDVSLRQLFADPASTEGISHADIEDYAHLICRGGWPEAVVSPSQTAAYGMAKDYLTAVANEDISRVDGTQRNPAYALLVMRAYASKVTTQANMATIRGDMKAQGGELARNTVDAYVAALRKLYVFEDLEAWKPSLRDRTRITTTPTRHFVDPSLAAAAMGATPSILLKDAPTLGTLFESLCIRDLRIYVESMGGALYHYHDDGGREADAVIVLDDGRWALVEVKLGETNVEEGARNLAKLKDKIDCTLMGEPAFLMVMTVGRYAYQRKDGVVVVPPACLRP